MDAPRPRDSALTASPIATNSLHHDKRALHPEGDIALFPRQHADNILTGQTGLGKSTLINTIFASNLVKSKGRLLPTEPIRQTSEIQAVTHVVEENGVRLRLNIVDTPGYGDLVNNDRCWDPIVKYIKDQHSAYLRKELTAQRERYVLLCSKKLYYTRQSLTSS